MNKKLFALIILSIFACMTFSSCSVRTDKEIDEQSEMKREIANYLTNLLTNPTSLKFYNANLDTITYTMFDNGIECESKTYFDTITYHNDTDTIIYKYTEPHRYVFNDIKYSALNDFGEKSINSISLIVVEDSNAVGKHYDIYTLKDYQFYLYCNKIQMNKSIYRSKVI